MTDNSQSQNTRISSTPASQNHSGLGDNVAGNKIIVQAVSPNEIRSPIEQILTELRYRRPDRAKEKLTLVETQSNLNVDSTDLLSAIRIAIDIFEKAHPTNAHQRLTTIINAPGDKIVLDIVTSVLIRLEASNENASIARERYEALELPCPHSKEIFLEFVADLSEIEHAFTKDKLSLSETELCGLARGAIRLQNYPLTLSIVDYLNSLAPTFNSKVLLLIANANSINDELAGKHYWSISATTRDTLLTLCDECIALMEECEAKDFRVLELASNLSQYIAGEYKPLLDACWKYISEFEKRPSNIVDRLRGIYQPDKETAGSSIVSQIKKAHSDRAYKKSIISQITSKTEISTEQSVLLSSVGDKSSIKKWLKEGGTVTGECSLEEAFALLELKAFSCEDNPREVETLRGDTRKFIDKHNSELLQLNPHLVIELADSFLRIGLCAEVCEILVPHIPEQDIWVSPIIKRYIDGLLNSHQLMTLNTVLGEIDQANWDAFIWRVRAQQHGLQNNYGEAAEAIEHSLSINPLSLFGWYFLIRCHKQKDSDKNTLASLLTRIPTDLFENPSEIGYSLLLEIAINGDFKIAELILLEWFLSDPVATAKPLTNFNFSLNANSSDTFDVTNSTDKCLGGLRYTIDGKVVTQLLVNNYGQHQCLLPAESPLGELLSDMELNQTEPYGINEITLIARMPPFTTALNIAISLRLALNDGSDCFYEFSLPEDPQEMFESLEKKLSSLNKQDKKLDDRTNIPIFMMGYKKNQDNAFKSALVLLTSKDTKKSPLPNFGVERPDAIVLDVYSIAYLAITGLAHALTNFPVKTIITKETKFCAEYWLEEINREDYLAIDVDDEGRLFRHTFEDMQEQTASLQEILKNVINQSAVLAPNLVDMPPDVMRIENIVDISVFSSQKLCIANDIPWLCIDLMFAQLASTSGHKVVNANQFFTLLGKDLNIKQKQGILLHAARFLPYPLTFDELIHLSKSKEEHDLYALSELLCSYPRLFKESGVAVDFLHRLLLPVLVNAYVDGEILRGFSERNPRNNGFVESIFYRCCYISMQCEDAFSDEKKIARLLATLFVTFHNIQIMTDIISELAFGFVKGHFLDLVQLNEFLKEEYLKQVN